MKEERFPHTRKPLHGRRLRVAEGGSFGATEESTATGMRRAKRRGSRTEDGRRAALTSARGLSAQPLGRAGLGAEAPASVLARREPGKKSAAAEEARDFFLPLCFLPRKERGFRAPPKRTPETGASRSYQRGSHSNRGTEGKTERFPHRGLAPSRTHQPERLVCSPTGKGGGWEPRLRLWSDRRERTAVVGVNTA